MLDAQTFYSHLTLKCKLNSSLDNSDFALLKSISIRQPYWLVCDEKHHKQSSLASRRLLTEPALVYRRMILSVKAFRRTTSLNQSLWWCLLTCGAVVHVSLHPPPSTLLCPWPPRFVSQAAQQSSHACLSSASFVYGSPSQLWQSEVFQGDKS